jgi:LuxR family transcriptional regulator, maltose regulon positive regulatory protein
MLGIAVQGLALVASGAVKEGMLNFDEVNAAVIAGELTDRVAVRLAGCCLIAACERVHDYGRAVQWCKRLKEYCAKWGLPTQFA